MSDKQFPEGLRFFKPRPKSPDFVIGNLIVTPNALFSWLKKNESLLTEYEGEKQLKLQIKTSKDGKAYLEVDTYKKEAKEESSDSLPF